MQNLKCIYCNYIAKMPIILNMGVGWLPMCSTLNTEFLSSARISIMLTKFGPWQNGRQFADDIFKCIVKCNCFIKISSNVILEGQIINTLRPRSSRRNFADDMFKCISLIENVSIPIQISLKFVPTGPINNIPALVQIMAWRRPGDKPLSEPMMDRLPTHICVTRPQWVNS